MSVMIFDPATINALAAWASLHDVTYYRAGKLVQFRGNAKCIALLWRDANVASFVERYRDKPGLTVGRYAYRAESDAARQLTPMQVVRAVHGLDYQMDYALGWDGSEGHAALVAIERAAIRMLPGYAAAPLEPVKGRRP